MGGKVSPQVVKSRAAKPFEEIAISGVKVNARRRNTGTEYTKRARTHDDGNTSAVCSVRSSGEA